MLFLSQRFFSFVLPRRASLLVRAIMFLPGSFRRHCYPRCYRPVRRLVRRLPPWSVDLHLLPVSLTIAPFRSFFRSLGWTDCRRRGRRRFSFPRLFPQRITHNARRKRPRSRAEAALLVVLVPSSTLVVELRSEKLH